MWLALYFYKIVLIQAIYLPLPGLRERHRGHHVQSPGTPRIFLCYPGEDLGLSSRIRLAWGDGGGGLKCDMNYIKPGVHLENLAKMLSVPNNFSLSVQTPGSLYKQCRGERVNREGVKMWEEEREGKFVFLESRMGHSSCLKWVSLLKRALQPLGVAYHCIRGLGLEPGFGLHSLRQALLCCGEALSFHRPIFANLHLVLKSLEAERLEHRAFVNYLNPKHIQVHTFSSTQKPQAPNHVNWAHCSWDFIFSLCIMRYNIMGQFPRNFSYFSLAAPIISITNSRNHIKWMSTDPSVTYSA